MPAQRASVSLRRVLDFCILLSMLRSLRIKNLGIVENIQVEFNRGLNVITGETGAGKSIITGALGLILGERADKGLIRAGEDTCGVEAVFEFADTAEVDRVLEELGLPPCDSGRLILRRLVSSSGTGKSLVNDSPVTVQALARLGNLLVDMHGPHDHQSLLRQEYQLDILDSFARLWSLRSACEEAYERMMAFEQRLQELQGSDQQTVTQQIELLRYQIQEIETADIAGLDEEELDHEYTVAANAQRILELANAVRDALVEDENSAFARLAQVQSWLEKLAPLLPEAEGWRAEARSAAVQIQELAAALLRTVGSIETDPARLQRLEERKATLYRLKRKYGGSTADILRACEKTKARLRELETRDEQIAACEKQLAETRQQVLAEGTRLSRQRRNAARELGAAVTRELQDLGFQHGVFEVRLETTEPGPAGLDSIEFEFAPNVGEPKRPLRLIASSGEISRVMLATKTVLVQHDKIPVLVFDEIDANVGGEMGNAIGKKLVKVAANHQVLCVTHLPQVAVHGSSHFVVTKEVVAGRTCTRIKALTKEERVEEVARMLGGRNLTSVTLKHAREMLRQV